MNVQRAGDRVEITTYGLSVVVSENGAVSVKIRRDETAVDFEPAVTVRGGRATMRLRFDEIEVEGKRSPEVAGALAPDETRETRLRMWRVCSNVRDFGTTTTVEIVVVNGRYVAKASDGPSPGRWLAVRMDLDDLNRWLSRRGLRGVLR